VLRRPGIFDTVGLSAFFLSNPGYLLFKVIWPKPFGYIHAADVYAATIAVMAFMGGSELGS